MLRDGTWQRDQRREVVPGDVVRLSAGDLVPADARLLEARDLYVQQAALTGESLPVEKDAARPQGNVTGGPDAPNLVFSAPRWSAAPRPPRSSRPAPQTAFGDIAARLVDAPGRNGVRARA